MNAKFFTPNSVPIQKIFTRGNLSLYIKREDLVHAGISGNKFWKLYHNVKNYAEQQPKNPMLVTFGGAFSNHILAVAYTANRLGIPSLGIIRGEEWRETWQENPTLFRAKCYGMDFLFVSREAYRDKEKLSKDIEKQYSTALLIPEGGTNESAVLGIQNMLCCDTEDFTYLCTAVGTGGTVAGLSKYALPHQCVLGFSVVEDASLPQRVLALSGRDNVQFLSTQPARYGKFDEDLIRFINHFYYQYQIPLDPIYTGKMMKALLMKIEEGFFEKDAKILAFHTGGLQGVWGVNQHLEKKKKETIHFNPI